MCKKCYHSDQEHGAVLGQNQGEVRAESAWHLRGDIGAKKNYSLQPSNSAISS
jgi:hypothetical protein